MKLIGIKTVGLKNNNDDFLYICSDLLLTISQFISSHIVGRLRRKIVSQCIVSDFTQGIVWNGNVTEWFRDPSCWKFVSLQLNITIKLLILLNTFNWFIHSVLIHSLTMFNGIIEKVSFKKHNRANISYWTIVIICLHFSHIMMFWNNYCYQDGRFIVYLFA